MGLQVELQGAGFGLGQEAQVLDQGDKVGGLLAEGGDGGGVGLEESVIDGFEVALDVGEGSAEFVGNIGGQVAAELFGGGKVFSHSVEGLAEVAEFGGAGGGNALGEIALSEALGGGVEGSHGGEDAAGEEGDEKDAGGGGGQAGPVEGTPDFGGKAGRSGFPVGRRAAGFGAGSEGGGKEAAAGVIGEVGVSGGFAVFRSQDQEGYGAVIDQDGAGAALELGLFPTFPSAFFGGGFGGVVGVEDDAAGGVGDDKAASVEGGGLFEAGLQAVPSLVFAVVAGDDAVDAFGAEFLAAALEAVSFLGGGETDKEADPGQGQSQSQGEGQNQPEAEAEEPIRRGQVCTLLRRWYGCSGFCSRGLRFCGGGRRHGRRRCGRSRRSRSRRPWR